MCDVWMTDTSGVVIGALSDFGLRVGFHLAGDGADDSELGEQFHALLALELGRAACKVVDAAQADLGLLGLQHHDVTLGVRHCHARVLVEASKGGNIYLFIFKVYCRNVSK